MADGYFSDEDFVRESNRIMRAPKSKAPSSTRTERLTIRISPELYEALKRAAEKDGRSLAGYSERVLRQNVLSR